MIQATTLSCQDKEAISGEELDIDQTSTLYKQYAQPNDLWPKAEWYDGILRQELATLPKTPSLKEGEDKIIALGKVLFFDNRLGNGNNSCASCHNPDTYWIDKKSTAEGIATHHRNTPSMENVWYLEGNLFHDGRAKTYHEQIAEAIESPIEMGGNTYTLPAKLQTSPGYVLLYEAAYGTPQITREGLLDAIAAYSKSIRSQETLFDQFVQGNYTALNEEQIEGLHLFRTKGKCINCHNGPFFTDLQYHNLGYAMDFRGNMDNGRFDVTGAENDRGKFRTPGLRNVAYTAPYMHNGSIGTLEHFIELISQGMPTPVGQPVHANLSPHIKNLRLSGAERKALVAFLNTLSSEVPKVTRPTLP